MKIMKKMTACHGKKSSRVHIGNWFVHVREQTVSKFVYLEFRIWKLLGNELNFPTYAYWSCTHSIPLAH